MSLHTGTFVRQLSESDTASSPTEGAESPNGTAAQSHSQSSVKPFGSAAAKFKIRSAKSLTTKDLRTKSFSFEDGKVEDSSQRSDPSKDLNKASISSASYTHTNTDDKETGKTLSEDTRKDSTLPIGSEKSDLSATKLNTQEDKSPAASDKRRGDESRRFFQTNKSKSLDWRAGYGNRTGMTSGTRDSLERAGTSHTQENQPSSVPWRIQPYNAAKQGSQTVDRKAYPISGSTSVRMNRVNFAPDRTNSGQSLPSRLKPRLSQESIGEGSSLWAQQQGEANLDQTDSRIGSWGKEQGSSNAEELTGNQTITERIAKLFGGDANSDGHSTASVRLKRSNTVSSEQSNTVDSTPSHRKYTTNYASGSSSDSTDSQQGKPAYNTEKAGTFPRGFSKPYFDPKQEPSTNRENRNDQRNNSSGLSFSVSTKPKWSTETSSVKTAPSLLPEDNKETSKPGFTGSPEYCSQSLERTRSRLAAAAQCSPRRNQSASSDSSSSISSEGVRHLFTTNRGIKEKIGTDKQSDKETTKRPDIENKYVGGLQDGTTQPKYPLAAHSKIHKEEEKDDVFMGKTEGRRGEGVLEKSRLPSSESVKNTISMFESLARQSRSTPEILRMRRVFSVPEQPKPPTLLKKSDSDKNLHFRSVLGDTESLRTNFFSKSHSNEESETPHSNSIVKVKPTLQQHQETYKKSVEPSPALKQMKESRTDQVISRRDEDERRTVNKKHMDEPDSTITSNSGFRNIGEMEEKPHPIPSVSQQSNVKSLLKQKSINVFDDDDDDDDDDVDENTPTNSPDRAPLTVNFQNQSSPGTVTVNGTYPKVPPNNGQSSSPIKTIHSSLNNSNNNNYVIASKDFTTVTPSMARWSSDEEEYDDDETDTEEDSDSGESSVTITSNMSQSDRRSFSL
ncbi:hypothetical protein M9458_032547, partial [Cirrhinus mrigala]